MIESANKNLGIVIQARMGSTRLPGKILKPFYKNLSILELIVNNIKSAVSNKYEIVIATSNNTENNIIEDFAIKNELKLYRGDECDVLSRFIGVGVQNGYSHILRICSDNPFISKYYLDKLISEWEVLTSNHYLSFKMYDGTPVIKTHLGFFAEIVSLNSLQVAYNSTNKLNYRENVTEYVYSNPIKFNVKFLELPTYISKRNDLRFTIDDIKDFEILEEIYRTILFNDDFNILFKNIDLSVKFKNHMIYNIKKYKK